MYSASSLLPLRMHWSKNRTSVMCWTFWFCLCFLVRSDPGPLTCYHLLCPQCFLCLLILLQSSIKFPRRPRLLLQLPRYLPLEPCASDPEFCWSLTGPSVALSLHHQVCIVNYSILEFTIPMCLRFIINIYDCVLFLSLNQHIEVFVFMRHAHTMELLLVNICYINRAGLELTEDLPASAA